MLYNVHHMGKALENLKQEGFPLIEEDIKHLSPYQKFAINLLGYYQLNLKEGRPVNGNTGPLVPN